jgi:hypothetical protein
MNYIIRVINKLGEVIVEKHENEHPSEDQLRQLAKQYGGEFCDVSRT